MAEQDQRRHGARRTTSASARRQQARRGSQMRSTIIVVGGLLAIVVLAVVLFTVLRGGSANVGAAVDTLEPVHAPPYAYNTRPPTSGHHLATPGAYGFWEQPLLAEQVVHNMEHGATIIWFQSGDPALAGTINRLVAELGTSCLIAGSYDDMEFPVAVTGWGRLLALDAYDEAQVRAFVDAYRGQFGPEAGICFGEN